MTLTLEQRKCPRTIIALIWQIMKRDGSVELDCGHFAYLGKIKQIALRETEPHQFIVICDDCAHKSGDFTGAFLLGDDNVVVRDPEDDPPAEKPIMCHSC